MNYGNSEGNYSRAYGDGYGRPMVGLLHHSKSYISI